MSLKKTYILLILFIGFLNINSLFYASDIGTESRYAPESTLERSVQKAVTNTNFNGSVMISRNTGHEYDVLYEGAAGKNGGYSIDTLYDVGSVSKLYTTTAIMLLQQQGKLEYSDKISKYIDNVPSDKQNVTIKMLLTHTSGIFASENPDHNVTKEAEIKRILNTGLQFTPGTNYTYSNSGFTLLAAIIESASGQTYEEFLKENIFDPLGLEHTGFPSSEYLKNEPAVSGTLNGESYGKVNQFDFGWYSKGYADVLTTPRELTYFFQTLISGKLLNSDNLKLMNLDDVDLGDDTYRGYGTDVKHYGKKQGVVGHTGIWYGGNTAAYYRPSDKILFILTCDQLTIDTDLPANHVFNTLNGMYPSGYLKKAKAVDTVPIKDLIVADTAIPTFQPKVEEQSESEIIDPLTKSTVKTGIKADYIRVMNYSATHQYTLVIILCILLIALISTILFIRLKAKRIVR